MDWVYVRIWGMILVLVALGAALVWALGFAVYLNRIGSRGWASTRRLLRSSLVVFIIALPLAVALKERVPLWALLRSSLGSAEGQFQTGILYQAGDAFLRPNQAKALAAFRRAALQGHSKAQLALARACYYGRGTARDNAEALRWARAAAQAGQPLAMVLAGVILQEASDPGAEASFARAVPLLLERARQGDADASYSLGYLYQGGLGVARDPVAALAWMLRAQRLGISPLQVYALQRLEKSLSPDQRAQAHLRAETPLPPPGKT